MSKVVVLGAGQWGSTLAQVLCDAGNHVLMWGRNQSVVDEINEKHTNTYYLENNALPVGIKATTDLKEAFEIDPQPIVEWIRENGKKVYSDYAKQDRKLIV